MSPPTSPLKPNVDFELVEIEDVINSDFVEEIDICNLTLASVLYDQGKYLEAANLGHPKAQGEIASQYYFGDGDDSSFELCFMWAHKAAVQGDLIGQFRLAIAFDCGQGVDRNWIEALKWYQCAAQQGDAASLSNIGGIYFEGGFGVDQDIAKATHWLLKGAEAGVAVAQRYLGEIYFTGGDSEVPNIGAAYFWLNKAADQNDLIAQRRLGILIINGEFVNQRLSAGVNLLQAASDGGDFNAKLYIDLIKLNSLGWE